MPDVQLDPTAPLTDSPTVAPTTAPATPEWRVPDSDPRPWARGKTASELLNLSDVMFNGLQQIVKQQPVASSPSPSSPPDYAALRDDDVVDGKTVKNLARSFEQALAPLTGNLHQQAQVNYTLVKAQPKRADTFQQYEPEILQQLAGLPHHLWTLDNIATVADVIASRHVDEIAERRAQARYANMQGLPIRGNGLGSAPTIGLESDGLPTNYQEILAKRGLDLAMVRGSCAEMGMTVAEWFKAVDKMQPIGSR